MDFGDYLRITLTWGNPYQMLGRRLLDTLLFLIFISAFSVTQTVLDFNAKIANPLQSGSGQPVVLIFVREDCPISKRYAPTIQRISENHKKDARFYLVFPDKSESSALIRKYLSDFRYSMPGLRDPEHELVKQAHAQITPEAAVFDARGALVYHGRIDNLYQNFGRARPSPTTHELEDAINATLAGRAPAIQEAAGVGCYISDLQ
jgi:thiol-disulfide isomerase/thioredoxin